MKPGIILLILFHTIPLFCQVSTELEHFITIGGEEFHYTEFGEGEQVVLFLHGFALSSLSYRKAKEHFDPLKYRLLGLDLKGFGFSCKPTSSDYSLEKQATIVSTFLQKMQVNEVDLVGHSYGGLVCIYLNYKQTLNQFPSTIRSTTLIDTPAYKKKLPLFMKAIMTRTGAFLLLKAPPLSIRTRIAINGGFKNYRYGMKEYLPLYQAILGQKENPNSLYQAASQAIPDNFNEITDTYPTFQTPFLILWGSNDTFISRYHAENMLMDFQDARLEIIPNTSHNPHEENPEKVYDLIKSFYGDNS